MCYSKANGSEQIHEAKSTWPICSCAGFKPTADSVKSFSAALKIVLILTLDAA